MIPNHSGSDFCIGIIYELIARSTFDRMKQMFRQGFCLKHIHLLKVILLVYSLILSFYFHAALHCIEYKQEKRGQRFGCVPQSPYQTGTSQGASEGIY